MQSMTRRYKLSKLAEKDLAGIWRYTVDNWSREQANKYVNGLLNACADIARAPESVGRPCEYVREGYRKYPFGRHIIFYKILEDGSTLISRVLHEQMDFGGRGPISSIQNML